MMNKLSNDTINEIVDKYKQGPISCKKIGEEYYVSASTIRKYLEKLGVKLYTQPELVKKYTLDEEYFDQIDTESKAYFLGLLYADGCNRVDKTHFCISLQEKDKDILDKLLIELKSDRPFFLKEYDKQKNSNRQNQLLLTFNSKKLSHRLRDIGMVQNKEHVLTFPDETVLPIELHRHFIRGYYDGDGSFSVYEITRKNGKKQNRYEASIVSTEMFVLKIQEIIKDKFDMNAHISTRHKERNNSTRNLKVCGKQMFKFLEWMYEDSTIFLKRKHDKYLNELSKLPEWPILKKVNQHH